MTAVFTLLVLFQMKHFLADYPLQAHLFFLGKFRPNWKFAGPMLAHVAIHAAMTFTIAMFWGASFGMSAGLAVFDATIHFVMDRIKAGQRYMGRWKALSGKEMMSILSYKDTIGLDKFKAELRGNMLFWWCLGFDQMVHHLTDYVVIWYLVCRP